MPDDFVDRQKNNQRVDGAWRQQTQGLPGLPPHIRMGARNAALEATQIRDEIAAITANLLRNRNNVN